jgi:sugar/nucleoside kinase (ribokinase family)
MQSKLLVIGSVAYDSIITPFNKIDKALGGSGSYFSLASRFFTSSSLVGVVGNDFKKSDIAILKKYADISGLSVAKGKTFHWAGKYSFDLNSRETLKTELGVFANFKPKLSDAQKKADYLFLGNIHPELQLEVLEQIKSTGWQTKFIGLDTMNYWMDTALNDLKKVLKKVDCLIINDSEARQLSGQHNLLKAAKGIMGMMEDRVKRQELRVKTLIIKRGEYGLLMFNRDYIFNLPGFPLEDVIDPTGAGDSFAGGFMGYLAKTNDLSWNNLKQACVIGSVIASFSVEQLGTKGLLNITNKKLNQRIKDFKSLANF